MRGVGTQRSPAGFSTGRERRGLTLPSPAAFAEAAMLAGLLSLLFVVVYFGADALAGRRGVVWRLYGDFELAIPLVPVFVVPYLSMFLLYLLPVFQMPLADIRLLARRIVLCDIICGVIFVAMPTKLGFAHQDVSGMFAPLYHWIWSVDATHNLLPSLHVASSSLVALALVAAAMPALRLVYLGWLAAIIVSVILTHRHHLLDIPAGLVVVWLCHRLIPDRRNNPSTTNGTLGRPT